MGKAFSNYRIEERSFISYIKREVHMEVTRAGFSEKKIAAIDLIVSEMTSNIVKHAGSGELLYRCVEMEQGNPEFEVLCIDKGPGMADPTRMRKDGVSTTGTLGQGLGAIERLSTFSEVYSLPRWGTIVYSHVKMKEKQLRGKTPDVEIRALCVSKPREVACGDGYRVKRTMGDVRIFLGDGLGHGLDAKAAVDSAGDFFMATPESDPVEIIRQMHEKVRRTRGLVAAVAVLDKATSEWKICGVGNISVRVYTGLQVKNYMSFNGTVGLNIPTSLKNSTFPLEKNQHLIMSSDGIRTRWNLTQYPSIFKYDSTILAAAVYRDNFRGNDDASILVAKAS